MLSGGFHQLQAGDAKSLSGESIDFAHFGSGEGFHGRFTMEITASSRR
jgi:hypothetical protein